VYIFLEKVKTIQNSPEPIKHTTKIEDVKNKGSNIKLEGFFKEVFEIFESVENLLFTCDELLG